MDPMNEKALRQTISALSGEEVSIALEIMLALHPNRYLNTLALGYITMKSDNDRIKDVVDSRSNYIRIITGEIDNPANFERFMNPPKEVPAWMPKYEGEWDSGTLKIKKVDEEEEPQPVDPKKIEIPDFLG